MPDLFVIEKILASIVSTLKISSWIWQKAKKIKAKAKMRAAASKFENQRLTIPTDDISTTARALRFILVMDLAAMISASGFIVLQMTDPSPVSKTFVFIMCLFFLVIVHTWIQFDKHLTEYRNR